jgi:hypothetical protein
MKKFIKIATVLSVSTIFCLSLFIQNVSAQTNLINTGVTINKMTDNYGFVFAGTPSFPITLNFTGGPVSGSDLNMDVYLVKKLTGSTINKVATWRFNASACSRNCNEQTIPLSTSKWGSTVSMVIPNTIKIPAELSSGTYAINVAFRRGSIYAKLVPGAGVTETNAAGLEPSAIPAYEVGTFVIATPCTSDINSHYQFTLSGDFIEDITKGPEVAILQSILKSKGLYERSVNGEYNSYTASVVKKYQKSLGWMETGRFGSNEKNAINQYCNEQAKPVITKVSQKSANNGDIVTIEGRNFFSKKDLGNTMERNSVVELRPFFTYLEPISIEPTKIVVKIKTRDRQSEILVTNNGVESNRFPFEVAVGGNIVSGEPVIQKINNQNAYSNNSGEVVDITVTRGESITIQGEDFNLGNAKKVRFVNTWGVSGQPEEEVTNLTPTSATVVVPKDLFKAGVYSIHFINAAGQKIGNYANILIAGTIDPAIYQIRPNPVEPGVDIEVTGTNFVKGLDLYLSTKGLAEIRIPANSSNSNSKMRAVFKIPNEIAVGNYDAILKNGTGLNSASSNIFPLEIRARDTIAPSVPAKPVVTRINANTIKIDWAESTDNIGVRGYRVYRDKIQLVNVYTNTLTLDGIGQATPTNFSVAAFDLAGNISAQSAIIELNPRSGPVLNSVTPNSGIAEDLITINGANLSSVDASGSRTGDVWLVLPNSSTMSLTPLSPTDTKIQARVPNVTSGDYGIRVRTVSGVSNTLNFKINSPAPAPTVAVRKNPIVTSIIPGSGKAGDKLVVTGNNFFTDGVSSSNQIADVVLTNSGGVSVSRPTIVSQSNTRVEISLPANLEGSFNVIVKTIMGGSSNPWTIRINSAQAPGVINTAPVVPVTVTPPTTPTPATPTVVATPAPTITSILPLSAKPGETITLSGTNFTGVVGGLISISNSSGSISPETVYSSSPSSVVFKMPNVPVGVYNVELTSNSGTSNRVTINALQSEVQSPTPFIQTISPTSGRPNTEVTLSGRNLEGVKTDLLFMESSYYSGYPVVLSSSASNVTFRVPDVPAGSYKVYLFSDKGESNQVDFTVQAGLTTTQSLLQTASVLDWFISLFR